MSEAKRQHFVPRFYLRRFSQNGRRIVVFDKPQQRSFPANISSIASQKHFYDLTQELVDEILAELTLRKKLATPAEVQEIEEAVAIVQQRRTECVESNLSSIESRFADTLSNIIEDLDKYGTFDPNHRAEVSYYVALQLIRTQKHRELMREIFNTVSKALIKAYENAPEPHEKFGNVKLRFSDEYIQLNHILFMLNPDIIRTFAETLQSHIWIVGINQTPYSLYASDVPVVTRAHLREPLQSHTGLASPGIEISFPLTPKYVLQFAERTYFRKIEWLDGRTLPLNKDNIIYLNSLQVKDSYQQIYSPVNDFGLAKEICRDHPELTNPNRSRLIADAFREEMP